MNSVWWVLKVVLGYIGDGCIIMKKCYWWYNIGEMFFWVVFGMFGIRNNFDCLNVFGLFSFKDNGIVF